MQYTLSLFALLASLALAAPLPNAPPADWAANDKRNNEPYLPSPPTVSASAAPVLTAAEVIAIHRREQSRPGVQEEKAGQGEGANAGGGKGVAIPMGGNGDGADGDDKKDDGKGEEKKDRYGAAFESFLENIGKKAAASK